MSNLQSSFDGQKEQQRLARSGEAWKKWGPYLSERQWGTVREDYSQNGDAWSYLPHDQARSRAYRWGEDGIAGICDEKQRLCFALAFWNGQDPILKERLFGLTNAEGNHGEDVKEYYYYLDSTPSHSYMKYLYKYPQAAYPYERIVSTNRQRSRMEPEFELIDTGIFDQDRYFDIFVEYAKDDAESLLVRITAHNRGPEAAPLHVLPTLWFRKTWWKGETKPGLREIPGTGGKAAIEATHPELGRYFLSADDAFELLFTENETNTQRLFGKPNEGHVKDAFHSYLISGDRNAVNAAMTGTKAAVHYVLQVPPGKSATVRLRLTDLEPEEMRRRYASGGGPFGKAFDETLAAREREADEFYDSISPSSASADQRNVMRQALAGMLWSKQYYGFDVTDWLREHGVDPLTGRTGYQGRNSQWYHMVNDHIISMPDKWEYPWYAAWDLAFHTIALSAVDMDFAKQQLQLMLDELYLHPSGQIPAYEWNFGDVNPPVHAFATLFIYGADSDLHGKDDIEFLKAAFQKLLLNFTWWVNRKDPAGNNIFGGGFLGLDNIGVFDRSAPLATGGRLEQADGTAWMAFFCQNMLEISLELALHDPSYERMAHKFAEHFFWIAGAMDRTGENRDELWDEEDGFFYDLLVLPDGSAQRIKVRSLVGLMPLCATTLISEQMLTRFPSVAQSVRRFVEKRPELLANIASPGKPGHRGRRLLATVNEAKLRRILARMLDEERFLSPYGIRSLSRWHLEHPYVFNVHGEEFRVQYMPAESNTAMFGGNSNWRGPVWFPINMLLIRALLQFYMYYGNNFTIECPTGSGKLMNLYEVSRELAWRLMSIFLLDDKGRRPVFGGAAKFQTDPHWRDHLLFYEYFHGDNGAGIGASHQTGWTGIVGRLIQMYGLLDATTVLEGDTTRPATRARVRREPLPAIAKPA